jgi:hypothetical protein
MYHDRNQRGMLFHFQLLQDYVTIDEFGWKLHQEIARTPTLRFMVRASSDGPSEYTSLIGGITDLPRKTSARLHCASDPHSAIGCEFY